MSHLAQEPIKTRKNAMKGPQSIKHRQECLLLRLSGNIWGYQERIRIRGRGVIGCRLILGIMGIGGKKVSKGKFKGGM